MAQKRVFISGIAGFLGSHLADRFLEDGYAVVGCDNMIGGYIDNVPSGVEFHQVDCNDLSRLLPLMAGVDIVYHCAATAYEGLSVFSPHLVTQNIVTAATGIISAAVASRVRRFVLCSSMARYGTNDVPFTEEMVPRPQDPYGIGKWSSELLLQNIAETHGMEWVVAVPHNIIGPRQRYDDPYRNVASIFINLMLQGRQPYIYGDGDQRRCFSFVSDVVEPLCKMATDDSCTSEVINVGPDDRFVTINELAETIARLLDFDLQPVRLAERPREVYLATCSAAKARAILGYEARVELEDGLATMIDWITSRGVRPFEYHLELEIHNQHTPETWSRQLL
ncbi:NAD-dependent epimerase/dehydratase family protein [Myxococcota bacterium]|nr:NAD-dependent epimerase/dehydratase family protein [Myxococcota bacterium]MBU1538034.1 NAD-dependent epimerase/dehydratase family protein [Myxococcota bacterium]